MRWSQSKRCPSISTDVPTPISGTPFPPPPYCNEFWNVKINQRIEIRVWINFQKFQHFSPKLKEFLEKIRRLKIRNCCPIPRSCLLHCFSSVNKISQRYVIYLLSFHQEFVAHYIPNADIDFWRNFIPPENQYWQEK